MTEIVLFGGTSEGRELAALFKEKNMPVLVCVATEYGESLVGAGGSVKVHTGRLDEGEMAELMRSQGARLAVDATHPYAEIARGNIAAACQSAGARYLRVRRERAAVGGKRAFDTMQALVAWLNKTDGIIFSTLGAKEAGALTAVTGFDKRVWLRILPFEEGLAACRRAGFPAARIICMQGPFSEQLNIAMFRAAGAGILITKESGAAGGFLEKINAARACGMAVAVLKRPGDEAGLTLAQIRQRIEGGIL